MPKKKKMIVRLTKEQYDILLRTQKTDKEKSEFWYKMYLDMKNAYECEIKETDKWKSLAKTYYKQLHEEL